MVVTLNKLLTLEKEKKYFVFYSLNRNFAIYTNCMTDKKRLITILGPTASGKTSVAVALAKAVDGEIISADSRQVYQRMDIGTGKDLADYNIEGTHIPYHLIDICQPGTRYNLYEYQRDFLDAYNDLTSRQRQPILCGGTGLYIESVLKAYNLSTVPQNNKLRKELEGKTLEELTTILKKLKVENQSTMHNTTDVDSAGRAIRAIEIETHNKNNPMPKREFPEIPHIIFGINISREIRRDKITKRLKQRLDNGMIDEVRKLIESGIKPENLIYYGLEYKYLTEYVIGKRTYNDMVSKLEIAIHQFAKRQMTWFRGMERRGFTINWIDATMTTQQKIETIRNIAHI